MAISKELAGSDRLLVALDFDGTLSPIVPRAEQAMILPRSAEALRRLHAIAGTSLAVISGRDIEDLRERLPELSDLWLAGSHGRSVLAPGEAWKRNAHDSRLKPFLAFPLLPEIRREVKEFSVAFHWRGRTTGEPTGWLHGLRDRAQRDGLEILDGRMVIEILIPGQGKEVALEDLALRTDATAIVFAGDDRTDLEAIRFANGRGIGIFVNSAERSLLAPAGSPVAEGPDELSEWLHQLADLRESLLRATVRI